MNLGVIGYGNRIRSIIKEVLRLDPKFKIVAVTDVRNEQIKTNLSKEGIMDVKFYNTPEDMLEGSKLDGVLIGTRCSLHTQMALKVLPTGLPIYMEKPVATNLEDLNRLKQAYEESDSQVVVSFPLRVTPLVKLAKETIDSGKIGTIEHVQAINNVPYGGVYFQNWYRDEQETGGLFLQKATHDLDYITHLLGIQPTMVCAMMSKQIFKGSKSAGLKCVDCEEQEDCLESYPLLLKKKETPVGDMCCFAEDTGNEDSGTAIVRYETGMHASYSQNFFIRKQAGARGARLMGYKGTIEFDFLTNQLKVFMHHANDVITHQVDPGQDGHGGGDTVLAQNFIDVIRQKAPSVSPLETGLLSALMCLKAKESAKTNTFQEINWVNNRQMKEVFPR